MKLLRSPLVVLGGVLVGVLVAAAAMAPLLAPYDPLALAGDSLQAPSRHHLLGTNNIGQDLFSQIIWGARPSLLVAVASAVLAVALGAVVGTGAGLVGGGVDAVVMRVIDVFLAVPRLPLWSWSRPWPAPTASASSWSSAC